MAGTRIDCLLVERGLAPSRERAQALILAGRVLCNEVPVNKAGTRIKPESEIRLKGEDLPYVGRGGLKLEAALKEFELSVAGRTALDVGASTGGFTDCLLQHGAAFIYAIDVGYGQLHWSLRNDPRVEVRERTNIRYLQPADFARPPDLAVIDVSFISLKLVLPVVAALLAPESPIIALVKPQFEVGKGEVGKGGVVRDEDKRRTALEGVVAAAAGCGLSCPQTMFSPIIGQKGNREFLAHFIRH